MFDYLLYSLSQWLNFKLSGITCLVGKISRLNFLSPGPGRLSEYRDPIYNDRFEIPTLEQLKSKRL